MPLAAGLRFAFTGWPPSPLIAVPATNRNSASVTGNALRLCGAAGIRG